MIPMFNLTTLGGTCIKLSLAALEWSQRLVMSFKATPLEA